MQTFFRQIGLARSRSAPSAAVWPFALLALFMMAVLAPRAARAGEPEVHPTVLLVHGAFADASSWNGVISRLKASGYPVVAAAIPLRGVQSDAKYIAEIIESIPGNVVLVGHSYGGSVITSAALGEHNVKALVYVAGLAPDVGESAASLSGKFPGSTLGSTLAAPILLADGGKDLYIQQSKFRVQFAADVSLNQAEQMSAGQRPITESALNEASGAPAWKGIPSWFIYGSLDRNLPTALQVFMARRAGAKESVEVIGASHVVMTSHPDAVARIIKKAADATAN
jgi:pimeloyl-ACP methyl ester carboxylesterase